MRQAFSLFLLAVAVYYTWIAFDQLSFLTANGRLGPGFFPRLIGISLIVTLLYSMVVDRRFGLTEDEGTPHLRDLAVFLALGALFVASLPLLGGLLSMVAFMLAALSVFNRGRHLQNLLVSVLLPAGLFLLFDTWLNAGLPEGVLPFPG